MEPLNIQISEIKMTDKGLTLCSGQCHCCSDTSECLDLKEVKEHDLSSNL